MHTGISENSNSEVAQSSKLARSSFLDNGRRGDEQAEPDHNFKHPLFYRTRDDSTTDAVVYQQGVEAEQGRCYHKQREGVSCHPVLQGGYVETSEENSTICASINAVQGSYPEGKKDSMRLLQRKDAQGKSQGRNPIYMWETRVSEIQEPTMVLPALEPHQIISLEYIGDREVWDLETKNSHTFFANGFAVHNCQELRHSGTQKYNAAKHIAEACQFRLGTSATPIYNYGGEIWNIVDVLSPDTLGTWDEFNREWCTYQFGDNKAKIKDPAAFGLYAREMGVMLRRTRIEVKRELPQITVVPHRIDANPAVIEHLKGQAIELAKLILKQTQDFKGQKMQAAGEFDMRMRQATGIAKAPYVAEFVKFLVEDNDEPVVLYGWHREVYSIWMERLKDLKPVMYTGSESPTQKEASKQAFLKGESKVMIISLRAGAGMDGLQDICHLCVFGELDWSPGVHEQCLSNDTEILTKRGFVGRLNISEDDEVAAFDTDTEQIVWCTIDSITDRELSLSEVMYSVQQPGMDLRLTGGHRMVYRHAWGKGKSKLTPWKIQTAEELSQRGQSYHLPVAGIQMAEGVPLSDDELRFLGWFVTDGNRNDASGSVTICQNENSPYTQNILDCLKACGFHYTTNLITKDSQWERSSPLVRYCIPKYGDKKPGYLDSNTGWNRLDIYLDKNLSPSLEHMDTRQLGIFLEAVHMGDGNKQLGKNWIQRTYHITSGNSTFIERLQSLCIRRGWRANLFTRNDEDGSVSFVLHTKPIAYRSICGTASKGRPTLSPSTSQPGERVWCITNRLGTLIVRRNGKTAIVGNCIGRIHRDGQDEPVTAYYLLSEHGSDPVMSDLLGIKRQQIEGVRDPNQDLVTKLQVEADYIKRMAEKFLTDHGIELPKEETIEPLI